MRGIALGAVAGLLSGLFGVGGGILIVPALVLVFGMTQRLAHGTSLAAVLPIATSGLVGFAVEGEVDWPVAALLAGGAMAGAVIGTRALHSLSPKTLRFAFAGFLLATAVRLLFQTSEASGRSDLSIASGVALVALGVLTGAVAGLLGVGGGIVMVPALILLFGVPATVAKGTSLAVIIPAGVVATQRNLRVGNAGLRTAIAVGLAGVASAFLGAKISTGLDERMSNLMFAALLAIVAIRLGTTRETAAEASPDSEAGRAD